MMSNFPVAVLNLFPLWLIDFDLMYFLPLLLRIKSHGCLTSGSSVGYKQEKGLRTIPAASKKSPVMNDVGASRTF